MASKEDIERLKLAIEHRHKCRAEWIATGPIKQDLKGHTVWEGNVETFALLGHPRAKRVFAWVRKDGGGDNDDRCVTVLELPPVKTVSDAVKAVVEKEIIETRK